jgi:RimJ/RimL family protein N-acetyltransferase
VKVPSNRRRDGITKQRPIMTEPEPLETYPAGVQSPVTVALRDGATIEVAAMDARDAARLVRFHSTLSPDTTYLRFFSFHPELQPDELHRFTHVDHHDREALVAVAGGEIVAVGRFDRIGDGSEAEVAFVVADSWQGRGICTVLFEHLAARAREVGVERFVAETLAHNGRMLAVFRHAGLPITESLCRDVVHLTLAVGPSR